MSLKAFHIFFITVATALCFGFAVWLYPRSGLAAAVSVLLGIGLIVYGAAFWKKVKALSSAQAAWLVGLGFLGATRYASACAVCFGDPTSPQVQGMNWAIWTLLAVLLIPLGGIAGFMVHLSKGAKGARK